MAVAFVASVGMASAVLLETKTLYAGQYTPVGTVTVEDIDGVITITYELTDLDWELTACHVYVDTGAEAEPPEKSAPGQFPFKGDVLNPVTVVVPTIDSPASCVVPIFIAAQAKLQKQTGVDPDTLEPTYQYESGWASGGDTVDVAIPPGKNWATYFEVTIPCPEMEVLKEMVSQITPIIPGAEVTFEITVTNDGAYDLNTVDVVDTLPAGMSYVATGTLPEPSIVDGNMITWNIVGPLNPGASTMIPLVALIAEGTAAGTLTNEVTVTGTTAAGDTTYETVTADVTVVAAP